MTQKHQELRTIEVATTNKKEEEYNIPLDISDIISICKEFNKLGWKLQHQIENILEVGVEETIKQGNISKEALPHIKSFLKQIVKNAYFGDATTQAQECIQLINNYEDKYRITYGSLLN